MSEPARTLPVAYVAGDVGETVRFSGLLRPEDGELVRRLDFARVAAVAALAPMSVCDRIEIVDLRRVGPVLYVTAVRHRPPPSFGCITVSGDAYDVVVIRRSLLGRPLPRRVVLQLDGVLG